MTYLSAGTVFLTMNRLKAIPAIVAVALLAGCAFTAKQGTLEDRVAQSEATFTGVVQSLTELRKAGKISDAAWEDAKKDIRAGNETYEAIHAIGDAGDGEGAEDLLTTARRITRALIAARAAAGSNP